MRLSFGAEFDVTEPNLDTAAVGVPPRHVVDAVRESVDGWANGKLSAADFDAPIATARAAFGTLVGVEPESVAIGSSTSALLALVAAAVPEGATVVRRPRHGIHVGELPVRRTLVARDRRGGGAARRSPRRGAERGLRRRLRRPIR